MARFLVVLQPAERLDPQALIQDLDPLVRRLEAQVEHRTACHLSALLRDGSDNLRLQLFADVQAKAVGQVLELVLMSREPMGRGAPLTRERFQRLVQMTGESLPGLRVIFRSDRDGPLPDHG